MDASMNIACMPFALPPRKEFIVQGAYEIDADRIDA